MKSFMQYLYPNVMVYPDEQERGEVIKYWHERLHKSKTFVGRSKRDFSSRSLPSWQVGRGGVEVRPHLSYWALLVFTLIFSLLLIVVDLAKRQPIIEDKLATIGLSFIFEGSNAKHLTERF